MKQNAFVLVTLHLARRNGIRYPKIRLQSDIGNIKISLTERGREPGTAVIVQTEEDRFLGRIRKDGSTDRPLPPAVDQVLHDFMQDPLGMARVYGSTTGSCSFCGRTLTHSSSVELGYGPICAEKWGLFHQYSHGAFA